MKLILMLLVCLCVLYGCCIYTITKDLCNPVLAFSMPILISYLVNLLYFDGHGYDISFSTYVIYFIGVFGFVFGCSIVYRPKKTINSRKICLTRLRVNKKLLLFFKTISIAGTIASIQFIFKGATSGVFGTNVIRNIRYYSLYISENSILGKYSIIFIEVLFCVYAYRMFVLKENTKEVKAWFGILLVEYVIAIATTMARTVILQFAIELICIYLWGNKTDKSKRKRIYLCIIIAGIIALCMMQLLAITTEKATFIDEMSGSETSWLIPYFGKEFYIFDKYIYGNDFVTNGINSLGLIGRILQRLNVIGFKHSIDIPGGQVGSFITGPYTDFGVVGVLLMTTIYGALFGFIYKKASDLSGWWVILYSACLYSCVISFYAFQFMMSSHVYILVLIILLNTISGKIMIPQRKRKDSIADKTFIVGANK